MRFRAFECAAFLSAFLLFQIQPLTSKALVPAFGGSYLVWGACMVFFQVVLLGGYLYAHAVQRRLGSGRYAKWHLLVLLLPFVNFPYDFGGFGADASGRPLAIGVFVTLLRHVGLPAFVLSTTSVVLQRWLTLSDLPQRTNPYALYASSNLGSMLGLLTYPLVVERTMTVGAQGRLWWAAYGSLVVLHGACVPWQSAGMGVRDGDDATPERLPGLRIAQWFCLSAGGCAALLAATNVLTLDVASIPFLWVLPLSVYLLAFVVTFKRDGGFAGWMRDGLHWAFLVGFLLHLLTQLRLAVPPALSLALHLLVFFVVCANCAGVLVATKPRSDEHLTTFYLVLAAGGAAGSLLVSWVAPLVTNTLLEYPLSLAFCAFSVAFARTDARPGHGKGPGRRRPLLAALLRGPPLAGILTAIAASLLVAPWLAGRFLAQTPWRANATLAAIGIPLALAFRQASRNAWHAALALLVASLAAYFTEDLAAGADHVRRLRNFYGVYKVYDRDGIRYLQHGTTQHGRQYISGPKSRIPQAYQHPTTPVGEVLSARDLRFRRIGMIGLGAGAVACYMTNGQTLVTFELDPDNLTVAEEHFSYLQVARDAGARLEFHFGDGRLSLRSEPRGSFDLLIIDAFNSGSVPVHLLTVEAFGEYLDVVASHGLVLVHVSNKILDLAPVVDAAARVLGAGFCAKSLRAPNDPDAEETHWVAVTRDGAALDALVGRMEWGRSPGSGRRVRAWTDDFTDVFGSLLR